MPENHKVIDLSSPLGPDTRSYPTDPQFNKSWFQRMPENPANVSLIQTGLHSGSHVDAPLHFLERGRDVTEMPLTAFFGPAVCINSCKEHSQDVVPEDIENSDIRAGDIVLFYTGWGQRSNTEGFYDPNWPGFTAEAVRTLIEKQAKAIGFDSPSADSARAEAADFPAHKLALSAGLPIYESLVNLDQVAGKRFWFVGLPLKIVEGEASMVRAIAIVE